MPRRRTTTPPRRKSAPPPRRGQGGSEGSFVAVFVAIMLGIAFCSVWFGSGTTRSRTDVPASSAAQTTPPPIASLFNPPTQAQTSTVAYTPPATPPDAAASANRAEAPEPVEQHRQITGRKVPLRSEPRVGSPLVDRLNKPQAVVVLVEQGEWTRVRVSSTLREGWVPTKRLVSEPEPEAEPERPEIKIAPVLPAAVIIKRLIADSLASYDGSCPCPYNSDRAGRSCGRRSAYSRPGGAAPLCFAKDITPEMIANYRAEQ